MKKADPKDIGRLIAAECLSVRVRRLGRVINRIYDAALAPHGISAAQLTLLAAIAAGCARPGDLTRLFEVEKSTLSRDLKGMEQLGWIRSEATLPRGGRVLTLTPAGSRLLTEVRPAWDEAQAAAQAELGNKPFAQLRQALPSPLTSGALSPSPARDERRAAGAMAAPAPARRGRNRGSSSPARGRRGP